MHEKFAKERSIADNIALSFHTELGKAKAIWESDRTTKQEYHAIMQKELCRNPKHNQLIHYHT
jgi:hypothetical protein